MYDFEGAWVAQLVGFCVQYRFERRFLTPIQPGFYKFPSDGIYECCKNDDRDQREREYYQVLGGRKRQISAQEVGDAVYNLPRVRYQRVFEAIANDPDAIKPESAPYPSGKEFVIDEGYPSNLIVQTTQELWALKYNGHALNDWSHNNVGGSWIGCYVPLTLQLQLDLGGVRR